MATFIEKNEKQVLLFLQVVLVIATIGLLSGSGPVITGFDTATSTSRVVIQNYVSIAKSTNLTDGINFGTINTLPSYNVNASGNYISGTTSLYNITVAADSNVAVDFCFKAVTQLTSAGGAVIGLTNYTWNNGTTNSFAGIPFAGARVLTTSYVNASKNVAINSADNYRFWLNLTGAVTPGTYNNSVLFQGVPTGDPCT